MEKAKLDQLRIDRGPEKTTSAWRWLGPVLLLIVVAAGGFWWFRPVHLVEVRTVLVREVNNQSASTVLNASGYVTARRQATVSSKVTGKVTDVLIEEGMQVETGQILATLDDSNVRAALELTKAQLVSAKMGKKETESLLNEARINLDRSRRLVEQKLASAAELDRSRALAGSLEAQLERKQADVEVAARQVDIYQLQLEDTIIRAPFSGVIVAKNAQPGEMISPVSAGGGFTRTGIGTLVDMDSLEVEIDVNEAYINRVTPGQQVVATLDAYPDWKIPCHVIAIIPTADRQRATVEVRVGFEELDSRILPDMGVKVAFQESVTPGSEQGPGASLVVPEAAVQSSSGRQYVWVVGDGILERRAVSVSGANANGQLISSGLNSGEYVVVESQGELNDGIRVQEKEK